MRFRSSPPHRGSFLLEACIAAVLTASLATVAMRGVAALHRVDQTAHAQLDATLALEDALDEAALIAWDDLTTERLDDVTLDAVWTKRWPAAQLGFELTVESPEARRVTATLRIAADASHTTSLTRWIFRPAHIEDAP
ncbi:MAG: hypothetical protein KDA61_19930 [Planctomycetales bacterium]|nr:hypothetical protein [Planctomycetales bacterium]